jgi:hypothetical protein
MIMPKRGAKIMENSDILELHKKGGGLAEDIYTTALATTKGLVLAYWSKAKAVDQFKPETILISFWDGEGKGFKDPVLVDPLSGNIYSLPSMQHFNGVMENQYATSTQIFNGLPLVDYPLMILEKEAILKD